MKVLTMGALNLDRYYTVDHMVREKETITASEINFSYGGKALDQAVAIARAGGKVYHAGLVGSDGKVLIDFGKNVGVNMDYTEVVEQNTGHTIIQVDKNGQNCIILYGGANRCFTKEYIDRVLDNFERGDYILLQNEVNDLDYMIDQAAVRGLKIVLNPSPCDEVIEALDMSSVSMLFLNEIEGLQITGEEDPEKILEELKRRYPEMEIVLTLGSEGAIYQYQDTKHYQGIYDVFPVDTTAAGDAFTGYYLAGRLEGNTVPDAMALAAKASAITITRFGTASSIPTREEVEKSQIREKEKNE